jgi:transitional endoplasmic reticulum ATPase
MRLASSARSDEADALANSKTRVREMERPDMPHDPAVRGIVKEIRYFFAAVGGQPSASRNLTVGGREVRWGLAITAGEPHSRGVMADLHTLRTALSVSPDNIPLLLLFAQTALDEWATMEAREAYEKVLRQAPGHREASLGLARTLFQEGKPSEAAVRLEHLIADAPDFAPALVLLARIHLSEQSCEEAAEAYRRAVAMDKSVMDERLAKGLGLDPSGRDPNETARAAVSSSGGISFPFQDSGDDDSPGVPPDMEKLVERPKQKFSDVGGMDALKEQIRMKILYPMQNPDLFRAYGKTIGGGVLLYGPPGCGKTLISRATAGEIKAAFYCIGLHEILDMWIGSSEKRLHAIFESARQNAPSVLFFDEIDALAADRKDLRQSAGRTVINQFLAEMDGGVSNNDGVLILGATNAPWHIDPAFKRPGRFDRTIFVPPPDDEARAAIIKLMAQGKPVADLDAAALAKKTRNFSGADLKAVFDTAIEHALTTAMKEGRVVPITHKLLVKSAGDLKPSTQAWFESAKNYALYANQGGFYDDVLQHLGIKK